MASTILESHLHSAKIIQTTYLVHFVIMDSNHMLLPAAVRQGTLLWTKGYPMDKRAILWTKGLFCGQKKRPQKHLDIYR